MDKTISDQTFHNPPEKIKVSFKHAAIILKPYIWRNLKEQLVAVLPIVIYLALFQLIFLRKGFTDALIITGGIIFVIIGLMFFMEGLNLGLMPLGETIGRTLPRKATLPYILIFAFLVGLGATLAEPAIGVLKQAGANIDPENAPLLYKLLTDWSSYLVLSVGIGVGIATIFGALRLLYNWSLSILIIPLVVIVSILTIIAQIDPQTAAIIGLAWDCGGVTTGPVTVPLVLALGIGLATITGRSDTGMSGFGIVTLASLFPIIAVLILGLTMYYGGIDYQVVLARATEVASDSSILTIVGQSVWGALQAIVPLCLFLYIVQVFFLKEKFKRRDEVFLGIGFAVFGMILFSFGLSVGLTALGSQVGGQLPYAAQFYGDLWMKIIAVIFAFLMGFGATLAEPALKALGIKVESITVGAFKKNLLIRAVAFGVGVGISLGVVKIIFDVPLVYMLLPPYFVLIFITWISREEFVNIGWDSAGVTTGPITVPLVIAMGLGLGLKMGVVEGFGIISLASVCPILFVLILGLINKGTKYKEK